MARKILALVTEAVDDAALESPLGGEGVEGAEVLVVAPYDADEIVLFTHPGGKRNFLEEGLVEEATERFDPPVRHIVVE